MKLCARLSCLALGAALVVAKGARAEGTSDDPPHESPAFGFRLDWEAPKECPQDAEVLRQISELLGRAAAELPAFEVRGNMSRTAAGTYSLVLETARDTHRGTRRMQDPSCAELTAAGAAVIALAIDQEFETRTGEAAPPVETQPTKPAEPEPARPKPKTPPTSAQPARVERAEDVSFVPSTRRSSGSPIEASVGVAVAADLGTLPGLSPGPALSLFGRYESVFVGLKALWLPEQRAYISGSRIGGDFDYIGLELEGCVDPWTRAWSLAACVGVGFGRVLGTGTGSNANSSATVSWTTAQAGLIFRYPIFDDLFADAGAEVLIPFQHVTFIVENSGLVYEPAPVSGRAHVGMAWRFW